MSARRHAGGEAEVIGIVLVVMALCAAPGASAGGPEVLPRGFPTRRGAFAFTNAQVLAHPQQHDADLAWLSSFDILLANGVGIAGPDVRDSLQQRGCKLFLYFWTNALYEGPRSADPPYGDWCDELLEEGAEHFLSAQPLPSLAGTGAYYFDLANEGVITRLCAELAAARAHTGYDGIFFDYAGVYGLPDEVSDAWRALHPALPYDRAVVRLLRRLREVDRGCLIFTNQAYRSDEPILAATDYDLAESYATSFAWGTEIETEAGPARETYFRPWPGEFGIEGMYRECEARIAASGPRGDLLYLDYARPRYRRADDGKLDTELDLEAVYYSYCAAALWGRAGFCSGWYAGHEYRGPLYFTDLGRPLGDGPEELNGVVVREYERGLVALMTGAQEVDAEYTLKAGSRSPLYDLFGSGWLPEGGRRVKLRLAPSRSEVSGVLGPVGRVYLKAVR